MWPAEPSDVSNVAPNWKTLETPGLDNDDGGGEDDEDGDDDEEDEFSVLRQVQLAFHDHHPRMRWVTWPSSPKIRAEQLVQGSNTMTKIRFKLTTL